ncbi:MAG: hypothetical protein ON057_001739 [Glomeribacter sp. 1016415]|nr:hypothetical protein [Glomeribacter sp. 1016415]
MAKKTLSAKIWPDHLLAARREGLALSEYAKREGLSKKAPYYWQKKLRATAEVVEPNRESKFVAVRVTEMVGVARTSSHLILPFGMRLEISGLPSPEWLIELVVRARGVADACGL